MLDFFTNRKFIAGLFILFSLIASLQAYLGEEKYSGTEGYKYPQYNNYSIFKASHQHLLSDKDLYVSYPKEHWDLYKYSPTFAAFFGFFANLPDLPGLILWTLLNAFIFYFAIYYLPNLSSKQKGFILLLSLIELVTSLQNQQSNGLMAGLFIFAFGLAERKHFALATLLLVISIYIKLFGLVAYVLFLFYKGKWKVFGYSLLWAFLLFLIPLIFIDLEHYEFLLQRYFKLLQNDPPFSNGYSVQGWLISWFGLDLNNALILLFGAIGLFLPFVRFKNYKYYAFRLLMLASILIWVVIFNHKAESPTYIIAMAGVMIWFIISPKNKLNSFLFIFAFIFTSLSPTDLFPSSIRLNYVIPFALKALPCILIWLKIIYDMLNFNEGNMLISDVK